MIMKNPFKNTLFAVIVIGIFAVCSKNKDPEPVDDPADYSTLITGSWQIFAEAYFQENGKDTRELVGRDENAKSYEFTQDGKLMTDIDPKGEPYTVSGSRLTVGESIYTITKLNKKNLVFEQLVVRNTTQNDNAGMLYGVQTGNRQELYKF